ncbi:MAG: homoserine O-acetyltransferase [Actinobacteria bacterium]|nr:homoserine O-acetyltransferase [Actinomycetota bacterium]MBM3712470.1 homoserine O-acetyltransferase [Actinomycetota bacterium]
MEIIKEEKFDSFKSLNSAGIVKTKHYTFAFPPDELVLCSGEKLGPITIAYETYGVLNKNKDNAILIFHALSGDAHAAGYHNEKDRKPGWWDIMVGPQKPFNTEKYFVICVNVIGGCKGSTGPSSINPQTKKPYALSFPVLSIKDMIIPQKILLDYLGIEKLLCIAGGSMGGMQALQWLVTYPEASKGAMIIATAAVHSAQEIAFNSIGRYAIVSDPNWQNGNYYNSSVKKPDIGLSIARMIGHITYLSEKAMHQKFGRNIINNRSKFINGLPKSSGEVSGEKKLKKYKSNGTTDFTKEFEVESYLQHQGESFIKRFDANSYLYITKAIDDFDITKGYENLTDALKNVRAKCLVMSFTSDWLYPKEQSLKIVKALKINGIDTTYTNLETPYGHDSFLINDDRIKRIFTGFLKSLEE